MDMPSPQEARKRGQDDRVQEPLVRRVEPQLGEKDEGDGEGDGEGEDWGHFWEDAKGRFPDQASRCRGEGFGIDGPPSVDHI